MRSFASDYKFGIESEDRVKPKLEQYFKDTLTKTERFHKIDFKGEGCWVEIKTRTFGVNSYDTTLIPQVKIEYAKLCINPVYFVFVFTDGMYYIQYNQELFDTFEIAPFRRHDRTGNKSDYCFIPVSCLKRIE